MQGTCRRIPGHSTLLMNIEKLGVALGRGQVIDRMVIVLFSSLSLSLFLFLFRSITLWLLIITFVIQ